MSKHPNGLYYYPEWLLKDEEAQLISNIDKMPWDNELKRRRQQYGFPYNVKAKNLYSHKGEPMPTWLYPVAKLLWQDGHFNRMPDQAIINEYMPGQGISAHIDAKIFGPVVASISLNSFTTMELSNGRDRYSIGLEPRSLLVLTDNARWDWAHEIKRTQYDEESGLQIKRGRRVSITFRTVS